MPTLPNLYNKWSYEIYKNNWDKGEYGYRCELFKNGELVDKRSGFGVESSDEKLAKDEYLFLEFGFEREEQE